MPSHRTDFALLPPDDPASRAVAILDRLRPAYAVVRRGEARADLCSKGPIVTRDSGTTARGKRASRSLPLPPGEVWGEGPFPDQPSLLGGDDAPIYDLINSAEARRLLGTAPRDRTVAAALRLDERIPTPTCGLGDRVFPNRAVLLDRRSVIGVVDLEATASRRAGRSIHDRHHLAYELDAPQRFSLPIPDLKLVILEERHGSEISLRFRLTAADPELGENLTSYGSVSLRTEPARFFREFFQDVERQAQSRTAPESAPIAEKRLAAKGLRLYRELLPRDLQARLWTLHRRVRTLLVQSEEPWIPWELCKLQGLENGRIVEGPYFAEAFELGRWLPGVGFCPALAIRNLALVQPDDSGLPAAQTEGRFILGLQAQDRRIHQVPATMLDVQAAMADASHDAWHFTGHGVHCDDDPDRSAIVLEGGERLTPEDIGGVVGNLGLTHPLVVLNACQLARGGYSLTDVGGWAAAFLRQGAGAFIGASWTVGDAAALAFAQALYPRLLAGLPIAQAVREARLAIRRPGDPTWLAYALFAHPSTTVAP